MRDLTREILCPVAEALAARGYTLFHLEEPWLPYFGIPAGDWDDFDKAVGAIREATEGSTLVLHAFFGDAGPHVDRLRRLPVDAVGVDFVETDVDELGSSWDVGILAGALDGRSSPIEPVEGTMSFLRRLAQTLEPPAVFVSSNSELEHLPRDVAREKVLRLGEVSAAFKEQMA
jgi:methionine synthase II (cobalamin-independent)